MPTLKLALAAALAAFLAGPALAQAESQPASGRFLAALPPNAMLLSKTLGVDVIGADHVRVGEIKDVVLDRSGRAEAVVVGVGGFLGLGEKSVAVSFDRLLWNTGDVARAESPRASTTGSLPSSEPPAGAAAERMPGAAVSDRVLDVTAANRSAAVDAGTGASGARAGAQEPATVLVMGPSGGPKHAELHMTKAELQDAPAFRLDRPEAGDGSATAPKR